MRNQKTRTQLTLAASMLSLCAGTTLAGDGVFFSWERMQNDDAKYGIADTTDMYPDDNISGIFTTGKYAYCPQPAHSWGLGGGVTVRYYLQNTWNKMAAEGLPVAVLMRNRNAPWDLGNGPLWDKYDSSYPTYGNTPTPKPNQLGLSIAARHFETNGELNYVLGDIETSGPVSSSDIDDWMDVIREIATGDFTGNLVGDPDGPYDSTKSDDFDGHIFGDVSVDTATIQKWEIKFGNYRYHRYPYMSHGSSGSFYSDVTIVNEGVAGLSGNVGSKHYTFVSKDLNVLMPVTYTNSAQVLHVDNGVRAEPWTEEWSPTVRSAYLWCGVESFSSAVRLEHADGTMVGKEVIPWVAPFEGVSVDPNSGSHEGAWMPPSVDFLTLIKHLRLRGSDGFYFFGIDDYTSNGVPQIGNMNPGGVVDTDFWSYQENGVYQNPWYSASEEWADTNATPNGYDWWEAHALMSWEELDGLWEDTAVVCRLETDKESGVVVSAMNDNGRLHIVVSHMLDTSGSFDLDSYFPEARDYTGVTAVSDISVTSYSHTLTSDFFTPDLNWDGVADNFDLSVFAGMLNASPADERADWNQDGNVDQDDVDLFMAAYSAYNN